jgi:hypothetical protein
VRLRYLLTCVLLNIRLAGYSMDLSLDGHYRHSLTETVPPRAVRRMLCPWRQPSRRDAAPVAEMWARHRRTQRPASSSARQPPRRVFTPSCVPPRVTWQVTSHTRQFGNRPRHAKFEDVTSKKKVCRRRPSFACVKAGSVRSYSCPRTPPTLPARATAPDTPGPCRPQRCRVLARVWPLPFSPTYSTNYRANVLLRCCRAARPTRSHPTA